MDNDNQKRKPLWEDDPNTPNTPLRRPNPTTPTNNIHSTMASMQSLNLTDTCTTSDVKQNPPLKSTLSAEAKEWYPPGYKRQSVQDRLLKFKQNQPDHQSDSVSNGTCYDGMSEPLEVSVKLREIINNLIEDPGQFDNLLDQFLKVLAPYYMQIDTLHDIAKLIFIEAVEEPNFRYSAARLCIILETHSPLFRTALHLFAGKLVNEAASNYERDLALTLAELFVQSDSDNLYGNFVVQCIEKLVSVGAPDNDNLKCVCQVLKLTGAALDIHHRTKLNSIFNHLEQVKPLLPGLTNLIDYVITLRASHWGQSEINNYSVTSGDMYSPSPRDGPIFYGPDGKELSEEEKQFLADNCLELFNDELLDSDPDELYDPDNEMDEEVHVAFREFTKGNRE